MPYILILILNQFEKLWQGRRVDNSTARRPSEFGGWLIRARIQTLPKLILRSISFRSGFFNGNFFFVETDHSDMEVGLDLMLLVVTDGGPLWGRFVMERLG